MTVLFSPDVCLPNDPAGWGRWLLGHAAEHEQMRKLLLARNPPIIAPDYNLRSWSDDPKVYESWLETHQLVHDSLNEALNVTAIDFSEADFEDERNFFIWLDDHAGTHAIYRQILGIS